MKLTVVEVAEDSKFALLQVMEVIEWLPLAEHYVVVAELLLLEVLQQCAHGLALAQEVLDPVAHLLIGVLQQFELEFPRQLLHHGFLHLQVSAVLLPVPVLQEIDGVKLRTDLQSQVVHIMVELDQRDAVLIAKLIGEDDSADEFVGDVAEDHVAEALAEERVDNFEGVVGGDVPVADVGDGVDAPVDAVEVLDLPLVGDDGGVGGGRVEPAH